MRRFSTAIAYLVYGAIFVAALPAQVTVALEDAGSFRELRTGGTLTFDSEGVREAVEEQLTISYEGDENTYAEIEEPSLAGSGTFEFPSTYSSFPIRLDPGETQAIRVRFRPTGVGPFTGQLRLPIRVRRGFRFVDNSFLFNLTGRVAAYNLSFQLPGGNQITVGTGGTVLFEDTTVDTTMTATMIVTNSGSGPGTLEDVMIAGGGVFELGGIGLLPATIESERDFRFQVRFTPTAPRNFGDSIALRFGSGTSMLQLAGNGVAAVYSYRLTTSDGRTSSVPENGTIAVGSTPVGEEIVSTLTVTNDGSAEGAINNVTITGDGYSLSDRPLLPALLDVGESFTITINLTPLEPGTATGQLRIGEATFDLTAEGLGALFTYTLIDADGPRQIEPRDAIVFPQTPVGGASELTLQISNSGNEAGTLAGIGVGAGVFSLNDLPALPASLNVDQTISVAIVFKPDRLGPQTATLAVNTAALTASFTLNGIGAGAPDLPAVSFSTSGGTVAPAGFVPLGLSIAESFPVDIEGVLRLTFDTAVFSNDPTIQFSTGGRNAPFLIPKGETQAVFSGDLTLNSFLTGTVAGAITASATFTVGDGRVDITPDAAPEVVFTVNRAAPSLRSLVLGSTGQGRFSVLATGFATSRTVSELQIAFAGTSGSNLATSNLTVDVFDSFTLYYAGPQSSSFGSLFTATINFTVDEGEFEDLSTVTVTAANEMGQSNPVSLTLN